MPTAFSGQRATAGAIRSSSCAPHCTIARRTLITGNGLDFLLANRGANRGPMTKSGLACGAYPQLSAIVVFCWERGSPEPRSQQKNSDGHVAPHGLGIEGLAGSRHHDLAAVHHREVVGELVREVEVLLDQQDRHVAALAQEGDGAADVLDD